jgi:hypothetical protein
LPEPAKLAETVHGSGDINAAFVSQFKGHLPLSRSASGCDRRGMAKRQPGLPHLEEVPSNLLEAVQLILETNRELAIEEMGETPVIREPLIVSS